MTTKILGCALGCLLLSAACGDVTASPDAGPDSSDGAPSDIDASTPADATAEGDAGDDCDGDTGPECACVIFVDGADGSDEADGSAWTEAVATVQAGIDLAREEVASDDVEDCEVWVRAGVYVPGDDRRDAIRLAANVHLYGGFTGDEQARKERDWEANETVLSGDLNGDDDPEDPDTRSDNSYTVVIGFDDATLDGFTITGGNADGDAAALRNGGGLFNEAASPLIRNTTFIANSAHEGGGVYNEQGSAPSFESVRFENNTAESSGGGLYSTQFLPSDRVVSLSEVEFYGNEAGSTGGGLFAAGLLRYEVRRADFRANRAGFRGGAVSSTATLDVVDAIFRSNVAENEGGGGGGAIDLGGEATLTNVELAENSTAARGGAIRTTGNLLVRNATIVANEAEQGGAIYKTLSDAELEVYNSILWSNSASEGSQVDVGTGSGIDFFHSIVEGGEPARAATWQQSSGADPRFLEIPRNLELRSDSPAIDSGTSDIPDLPETDLNGNPRIVAGPDAEEPEIDLGPYEYQP